MEVINSDDTHNRSVSELGLDELRGWIIDRIYQIETSIDRIICEYYKPNQKKEFEKIILNSSIISLGGKVKILANISAFDKKVISKIQKIISIRNAFAHLPTFRSVIINGDKDLMKKFNVTEITESLKMEVMNSSGQLKTKDLSELRSEFYNLNQEIREYLLDYTKKR